jgi:hypothetical protein
MRIVQLSWPHDVQIYVLACNVHIYAFIHIYTYIYIDPGGVINPLFPPASPLLLHPPAPHASISGGGSSGICNTTTNTTGNSSSTGTYVASGNKALVHGQQTGGQSAQNQGTAASAAIHSVSVQMLQSDAFACIDASEVLIFHLRSILSMFLYVLYCIYIHIYVVP